MNERQARISAHNVVLFLGVIPSAIITVSLGGFGVIVSIPEVAKGDVASATFVSWVLAAVFGLFALASSSTRLGAPGFRLKIWETIGLLIGLGAAVALGSVFHRYGNFSWQILLILGPVTGSVFASLAILAKALWEARRNRHKAVTSLAGNEPSA